MQAPLNTQCAQSIEVLNFKSFIRNQERYLNYYQKQPQSPFCENYIAPKLEILKQKHPTFLK